MARPDEARIEPSSDVSILVCTRDRGEDLRAVLTHLDRVRVPEGWRVELLMIANGSTDGTRNLVEGTKLANMRLRYVHAPEGGKCAAFNKGVALSSGRVLLLTDDDVHVPPDWVEAMCRPILAGETEVVQCGIRLAPHLERPWLKGVLRRCVAALEDPQWPPEGLIGANVALSRRAFDVAGPYDVRLGPGAAGFFEDTTLGWALEQAGFSKMFRPEIAVEHHFRADRLTPKSFMAAARRMAVSRVVVDRDREPQVLRPSVLTLLPELPGFAFRSLTQLAHLAIDGQPDPGFMSRYYRVKLWQERHKAA